MKRRDLALASERNGTEAGDTWKAAEPGVREDEEEEEEAEEEEEGPVRFVRLGSDEEELDLVSGLDSDLTTGSALMGAAAVVGADAGVEAVDADAPPALLGSTFTCVGGGDACMVNSFGLQTRVPPQIAFKILHISKLATVYTDISCCSL